MNDPSSNRPQWNRREVLAAGAAAVWSLSLATPNAAGQSAPSVAQAPAAGRSTNAAARRRVLRLAHLSDSHTQPERRAAEGLAACLRHAQSLAEKPDLILTGGDLIMDSFDATRERTQLQWELYLKTLADECGLPVIHTLGNHDIWGWNQKKSAATGAEPEFGKQWACDLLQLPKPYRSYDRNGWHIIVRDSVMRFNDDGYIGRLDPEQFAWLAAELEKTPAEAPILICSHIPIVSATYYAMGAQEADERTDIRVPGGWSHVDAPKILALFDRHPNVRLCLSGHIHQLERIDFRGVTYICDGAVSANWWRGPHKGLPEGYGLVDLFDDGTFAHEYVAYGWKAQPEG